MTGGPRRKCPVCEQVMPALVCPKDRMSTLLLDAPVYDVPAPALGQVLVGRYEVREPIGQGGYGRVYRARHLGTGQDIALKILRVPPEEDASFAVQRFFLEARATSGLTHPNTVRVFDFGQDDEGRVFLAMELLAGRTLREELRVRKGRGTRFSDAEVVQIGVAITKSLSEAHEHGLVHRDLKPDNIFLHRVAGDDPVVKVLDFGIAKLGTGHRHTLSSDTSVPGTPAYMAPEHALNQAVDGRTDLYALGVVLYQLITLELPYQAPSDPQTLYMHAYEAVPDPRQQVAVAAGLAEVVMKAMQKRPEARFDDAVSMRTALAGALSQRVRVAGAVPAPARPAEMVAVMNTAPVETLQPGLRSGPPWAWLGLAAAVMAGLLAVWALAWPRPSEPQPGASVAAASGAAPDRVPVETPTRPVVASPSPVAPAAPEAEAAPAAQEAVPAPAAREAEPAAPAATASTPARASKRSGRRAPRAVNPPAEPKTTAATPAPPPSSPGKDVLNMRLEELLEQP